ncbi:MAG TPA: hypothetical protein VK618_02270 [Flavitalea sp.]|nr:hypothetical protein [Flavitalea sp.]
MEEIVPKKQDSNNGKRWVGLLLLLVGAVLILRQIGYYNFPSWLFGWEMIVIIIALCIGLRKGFSDPSWVVIFLVGAIFLVDDVWPGVKVNQFIIPIVVIAVGLMFLLSPKYSHNSEFRRRRIHNRCFRNGRNPQRQFGHEPSPGGEPITEDFLDITAVFGAVKKKVLSKTFGGGEIVCVMGGAEINLMNADFKSPILIDCVQVFGGTKLIVPANWEVRTEATTVFGSVEDKRPPNPDPTPAKTLVIDGTMFFGGIEIKSY